MSLTVLLAYLVGMGLGLAANRSAALGRVWPVIVRTQILVAAIALSIIAVWRIDSIGNVLWPFLLSLVFVGMTIAAWLTNRAPNRGSKTILNAWAAGPNTGFWAVPVAAALVGPAGALTGVLMDRIATPFFALWIWILRKEAPIKQRRRTSLVDQAPTLALLVGLALHLVGPAPAWTSTVTNIAVPLMAAAGAAIFMGSVLHPTQRIDPRPGVVRWLRIVAVRILLLAPIIWFAPNTAVRVVAVLLAFSIPAFAGPQVSVLYGYADAVMAAASRYGWFFGAAGLIFALLLTR